MRTTYEQDIVDLLREILEEIKGVRLDMAAQACDITVDLLNGAIERLPASCFKAKHE